MGKSLIIKGADFSENSLPVSRIVGTPGHTLIPGLGSGSFTINQNGFCYLPEIVTPDNSGRFSLGTYGTDNPNITKIVASWDVQQSNITSFTQLFCYFSNLIELDCKGLDTTGITDYTHAFRYLTSIKSIDLSTWDSNKNIITPSYMFDHCSSLEWVDLGLLEFGSGVSSTAFSACPNLKKVRTHQTNSTLIGYIAADLNAANAGGSSNWVAGVDTDGCNMLTPSI